jgi:hypothetical protein
MELLLDKYHVSANPTFTNSPDTYSRGNETQALVQLATRYNYFAGCNSETRRQVLCCKMLLGRNAKHNPNMDDYYEKK